MDQMKWKYKIDVKDTNVFAEIEKERKVIIPPDLRKLILEANAATPEKHRFMVGNTERVFGAVLSFNRGEKDTDTVFTALAVIQNPDWIPFGIDPFGNYICLSASTGAVLFWNHETDLVTVTEVCISLEAFLASLY